MICKITNRIDRFLCRTCSYKDFSFLSDLSHRQLRAQYRQVMSQVPAFFPLLCHHMPDIRTPERSLHIRNAPESLNYPVLQDSQTYWYSWPGEMEFFTFACHDRGSKHVICDPMCQFTDHIGTCRCDHHRICFLCNRYMLYLKTEKFRSKVSTRHFISCESFKSDRIDKFVAFSVIST